MYGQKILKGANIGHINGILGQQNHAILSWKESKTKSVVGSSNVSGIVQSIPDGTPVLDGALYV